MVISRIHVSVYFMSNISTFLHSQLHEELAGNIKVLLKSKESILKQQKQLAWSILKNNEAVIFGRPPQNFFSWIFKKYLSFTSLFLSIFSHSNTVSTVFKIYSFMKSTLLQSRFLILLDNSLQIILLSYTTIWIRENKTFWPLFTDRVRFLQGCKVTTKR